MAVEDVVARVRGLPTAGTYRCVRRPLSGGAETTLHHARFDRRVHARVVALDPPSQLLGWCQAGGIADAMIGGFFLRHEGRPLGELRIGSEPQPHVPFDSPWDGIRSCVHIERGRVALARRDELGVSPPGDLIQAGPMLVRHGHSLIEPGSDPEGFSAGMRQFDSDITDGRYPRAALGSDDGGLIAAVCDGRGERDHGMTLEEMAVAMVGLGCTTAINLDGGGSASLVLGGQLRNRPREEHGIDLLGGRAVSTALVFERPPASGEAGEVVNDL